MNKLLLLCVALSCSMFGCGGGASGSTATLERMYLTWSPSVSRIESDIVTGNTCSPVTSGNIVTDKISLTVISTAYPNSIAPSNITIQSSSIIYKPINTLASAHPLQNQPGATITLLPGTNTFDIAIAPRDLKVQMLNSGFPTCTTDTWNYWAEITFSGVEDLSGRTFTQKVVVEVSFGDSL